MDNIYKFGYDFLLMFLLILVIYIVFINRRKKSYFKLKKSDEVKIFMARYNLDINEFYDSLDCDKDDFVRCLQKEMRKQDNVAVTSSVLNLIDEVNDDLIDNKDALTLANCLIKENCNSYPIKKLLEYWINHFIH